MTNVNIFQVKNLNWSIFLFYNADWEPQQQEEQKAAHVFQETDKSHLEEDGEKFLFTDPMNIAFSKKIFEDVIHGCNNGNVGVCAGPQCWSLGADQTANQRSSTENRPAGCFFTHLQLTSVFCHMKDFSLSLMALSFLFINISPWALWKSIYFDMVLNTFIYIYLFIKFKLNSAECVLMLYLWNNIFIKNQISFSKNKCRI